MMNADGEVIRLKFQDLKKEIQNQFRSQFVEDAIRAKLTAQEAYTLGDYSDLQLLKVIVGRNYNRDGTNQLPKSFIALIEEHFE